MDQLSADQLAKELQKSQALFEISQALAGTVDLDKTLQQIADAADKLIRSSNRTILHLLDDCQEHLQPVAIAGQHSEQLRGMAPMNFKPGVGIAGRVVSTGQPINIADVMHDERYLAITLVSDAPVHSLLVVPVKSTNAILGTLSVQSQAIGGFTDEDERLLTALGAQAAVAIEKARLYNDLETALQHEQTARMQLVQAEKLAALGRIVASVAHEMNNPLQAIQNALYLIQLEETLSPQAMEDLQTVLNETERMAGLIARLRETYRPAASDEFEPEALNVLVLEVQRLLATHLRHNEIVFEFYPDDNLPATPILRDQIKQVVLNICLNAVEAMPEGGLIKATTHYVPEQQAIMLQVADNGPSIDPKILPHIFDPFVTTKAREGGTGLGLAITYDIIQRHLGRIEVDSVAGRGTTFTIWLPLEPRVPTPVSGYY